MLSAFFNKIGLYASFALCQVSNLGCAYGAESIEPPSNLQLKLPAGFQVSIFAKLAGNYGQPRMLAIDKQGRLYAALASSNQVVMLPDANADGIAETPVVIASNLNSPNSLVLIDDTMLIANQNGVVKLTRNGEKWSAPQPFISNLAFGHHTQKTLKLGPDNHLYINIGSSCNVCTEADHSRATIQRYTLEGKPAGSLVTLGRHAGDPTWARGLRNSQSFAWHPKTGAMFATNNGSDMRSSTKNGKVNDEIPPEHLNKIEAGKHYGWPYCWGEQIQDPNFVGEANFCQTTTPPAITFISHSTPIGITFLDKTNWPTEYKSDAIVALHGSWNRQNPSGYKLVRVKFNGDKPTEVIDFATGWLNTNQEKGSTNVWGRPIDVIVGADGALYVSDDRAGYIYRITHKPN